MSTPRLAQREAAPCRRERRARSLAAMRCAPILLGSLALGPLACTTDNPAFMVTQGDGGSTAASGDASTSGRTTTDATTATTAMSGMSGMSGTSDTLDPTATSTDPSATTLDPGTTAPLTSGPDTVGTTTVDTTGDPGSSGDGTTTIGPMCDLAVNPEIGFSMTSTKPFPCGFHDLYSRVAVEPVQFTAPATWKLRVCTNNPPLGCLDPNDDCVSGETLSVTFHGPPELVPDLKAVPCLSLNALTLGAHENLPNTCRLHGIRLGDVGFDFSPNIYTGAVSAPSTAALPDVWPSIEFLGFTVGNEQLTECAGEPSCGFAPGEYQLLVDWKKPMTKYGLPAGGEFTESMSVTKGGQPHSFPGSFRNHASRARPGQTCDEGLDFDWFWIADHIKP